MKKYLTTSQAAQLCNVTRFTIRNWINEGKLKSVKTAGVHRRVLYADIVPLINSKKKDYASKPKRKTRISKTNRRVSQPIKKDSVSKKLKKSTTNDLPKPHQIEKESEFEEPKIIVRPLKKQKRIFQKGLFLSGKCAASIKNVIFRKKAKALK